jgi:hypothetical protein
MGNFKNGWDAVSHNNCASLFSTLIVAKFIVAVVAVVAAEVVDNADSILLLLILEFVFIHKLFKFELDWLLLKFEFKFEFDLILLIKFEAELLKVVL